MRLAKYIARSGLASRREAESWIAAGRVVLNGQKILHPACTVGTNDKIEVDGRLLPAILGPRLWRYYKPPGFVVTRKDERDRPTIFEQLPPPLNRAMSIGRLDIASEGLLLLSNDGDLARYMEHPETGVARRYRVRVHGKVPGDMIDKLAKGLWVDGIAYRPVKAAFEKPQKSLSHKSSDATNSWLSMTLQEGKNREIRKLLSHFGLQVNRLIRTGFGPYHLDGLERGGWAEDNPAKINFPAARQARVQAL